MKVAESGNQRVSRPRVDLRVMLVWLVLVIGGGLSASVLFDRLSSAMEPADDAESMVVQRLLEDSTGESDSLVILIDSAQKALIPQLVSDFALMPGINSIRSSASGEIPADDSDRTVIVIGIKADLSDQAEDDVVDSVTGSVDRLLPAGSAILGGYPVVDRELGATAEADLIRAELIALPIVLLLIGLALRSVWGAAISAALVLATITGGMIVLLALSYLVTISTFAINVVTMFGIGLAVDYGLLMVNRFRRERRLHGSVSAAVASTRASAGRTVTLSGLTVASALAGLLLFDEPIIKSMAYGGIGAVAVAVLAANTVMPALLRRWGHRIRPSSAPAESTRFTRLAVLVQNRPMVVVAASVLLLAILALPFGKLQPEGLDERALPTDSSVRSDTVTLQAAFPDLARSPIQVLASVDAEGPQLAQLLAKLATVPGIDTIDDPVVHPASPSHPSFVSIRLTTAGPPAGADAMQAVADIRQAGAGFEVKVGGVAARDLDFIQSLASRAPWAAAAIALLTFLILLLVTGGLLVAAKAVLMNVVSLMASLGVLVWIFQEGNLATLLNFTPTGGVELVIVLLAAVFAFGLSTDYEIFLLSNIMSQRHQGATTDVAVAKAIGQTGWLISVAAGLIIVVFVGFAAGDLLIIKQLGIGLAVAVLIDATIIRLLLAPALMTLLQDRNWGGPAFAKSASRALWSTVTPD